MSLIIEADDTTVRRTTEKVVNIMYKAVSCIIFLLAFGKFLVRNLIKLYQNQQDQPQIADDVHQKDDILLPFVEKLKQLEALVTELSSKPSRLPEEKDVILAESLNRIRSMEYDLQKTKKVRIYFLFIDFLKLLLYNRHFVVAGFI